MRLAVFLLGAFLLLATGIHALTPAAPLLADVKFGTVVTDSSGRLLRLGLAADEKYRFYTSLDQIAPAAVAAALEYEDKWFYQHPGVNPLSFPRAIASLVSGRRIGASTLTMQVARLKYRIRTNSLAGKLRQMALALAIEMRHSKQEILEAYFNLAPYGGNVEGIEAASLVYFHKSASRLTREESLSLAIVPQNPVSRNPVSGPDFQAARGRLGAKSPLAVNSPGRLPFIAPHLSLELEAMHPGKPLQTTLELKIQKMLEDLLAGYVERKGRYGIANASAMLVRWTDMSVCALAGSAEFESLAISGQVDGTRARRSPGSTLKPFIYALALQQGKIHPMSILPDTPRSFGGYDPENFDHGFRGPIASHEALKASRNLPAIYLSERLANPDLYEFLRAADVRFTDSASHYGLALALGGAEVTMRELASLYAMLANQGLWQPLRFLKSDELASARRLLSPEAAWLTLDMLRREDASITSKGRRIPLLYKTGTSNGFRDAWTVGIVGEYVLAVWVGNFDGSANPAFIGASAALPLFDEFAQKLGALCPLKDLLTQKPDHLELVSAPICQSTGDVYMGQCGQTAQTWLIPGVSPRESGFLRSILVDEESGLRACSASKGAVRQVWWEFWPADLARIFARAGISKPLPPEWMPECGGASAGGRKAPEMVLPKKGVAYLRRLGQSGFSIPLEAVSDHDAGRIHWYADSSYIGTSDPGHTIYWRNPAGTAIITAVDDQGASVSRKCRIETAP